MSSRYLDDILIIDNHFSVNNIQTNYPSQHALNKADYSDIKAAFLDRDLESYNGFAATTFAMLIK